MHGGPWPLDEAGRPLDAVELRGLSVDCVVGVYPDERGRVQPLELDAALFLDARAAVKGGLAHTVDYARLSGELRFLLESCSFLLLETAADALCRYVLSPPTGDGNRAQVKAVTLRLCKPDALPGVGTASLTVHRRADEYTFGEEHKPFGRVDIVYEDPEVGIYRLRVKPGGTIVTHEHRQMEENELVLGQGLLLQGRPIPAGTGLRWPHRFPHRYDNPTDVEQTVLCVDRPAFIPHDEVEVDPPAGGLVPVQGRPYYPAPATVSVAEPRDKGGKPS